MNIIIIMIILSFWMTNSNGQKKLIGKTYIAEVGVACKEMNDGGCMIYSYRILEFKKDSVTISYRIKAICTPQEKELTYNHLNDNLKKTYKYKIRKNILTIENYLEISSLTVQTTKIIGRDNERMKHIIFSEEIEQLLNK